MTDFINALVSEAKNATIPDKDDIFRGLIGSWKIKYVEPLPRSPLTVR